jgi:plasmid stabilization system protein ParE
MSIAFTPDAQADIQDATDDLLVTLGLRVALAFQSRLRETLAFQSRLRETLAGLEAFPHSGSPVDPPYPNSPGMRCRPVKKFTARVVYFTPTPTGIRVVRVLHAHQDAGRVFGV